MRVPFEWLKDFVDISASPEEVADRLTMVGLEVEGVEAVDGDTVFEVNVTPNRPDCLSILGIAREVAAAFKIPLKIPEAAIGGGLPESGIRIDILDPGLCSRYSGRLIRGVTVGGSPDWIKNRLEKCGIRSLDNCIVDITNYVLLELGHPLHAFDADKLSGGRIRVAKAGKEKTITTLDGMERKLPEDALLIWDAKNPVAVAGVMGGEDSGVTSGSVNIFLESAYFEPASIRRTSKELGLRSESSYRFERGTDIEFLEKALDRAALLMQETGGGEICGSVDMYPGKYLPKKIEVSYRRVNTLIGIDLKRTEIMELLTGIGIKPEEADEVFYVYPPAYRRDITEYVDVIEEIARLYGYGNIPVRVPRTTLSEGTLNRRETNITKVREAIRKAGFTEVINYSFMNPSDLDMLSMPAGDIRRRHLSVKNPLRQEDSLMRTTLLPSLINNFLYNISRGTRDIRFFEIARIFTEEGGPLPAEGLRLGGIFYRDNIPSLWKEDASAFFIVKGALQALLEELKIDASSLSFIPSEEVFLHKGKSSDLISGDIKIGFTGELGPDVAVRLNLKVHKPEIIVFELNLETLLSFIPERLTYSQIPRCPSVERDIAMTMDEDITSAEVMDYFKGYRSEFIEKVELFDLYKGKNIPPDKKSLAFRIIYRCSDRTLTDSEVEASHQGLVDYILNKTGGELRG